MRKKYSLKEILFQIFGYIFFIVFCIICIYPFYYIFIYSLSTPKEVQAHGITFLPLGFTLENYITMFKLEGIMKSFMVSGSRTIIGTAVTIVCSSTIAYVFTRQEFFARKFFYRLLVSALYISSGVIPYYITMKMYGLKNNYLLYILPSAVIPYYVILIKTYMESISETLHEAAFIDGANYPTIMYKIMMPLSKPILAAIGVFSAVNQWNSWYDNFLLVTNGKYQTLQLILLNFLKQADSISRQSNIDINQMKNFSLTPTSIRMTITMIAVIPVICVYPFLQKYFVRGIMIGAIKG